MGRGQALAQLQFQCAGRQTPLRKLGTWKAVRTSEVLTWQTHACVQLLGMRAARSVLARGPYSATAPLLNLATPCLTEKLLDTNGTIVSL